MLGFVTGASSGVGEAFACRLAADGWDLAITARRGDRLGALAERLTGKHHVSVQVHVADLADPGDVAELERVIAAAEPDLLVNNAGFGGYREFCDVDSQVVADLVSVHVMAVSRLARAAIPAMIARGSGAIINVASLLAFSGTLPPQPLPCRAVYAGAKAFQVAFTQALAGELAGTGVQVQVCCPGLIDTEFHAVAGMDLAGIPFPVLRPDEVAGAALAGLRLGEVVCVPGLPDPSMIDTVSEAQRALLMTAVSSGLAGRYTPDPGALSYVHGCGSGAHRDFVGFEVRWRQSGRREGLVPDAGRHLLAGLPQRNGYGLAGFCVGEQIEAFEPGLLAGAGKLFPGKVDDAVETLGSCLGCDHACEHSALL